MKTTTLLATALVVLASAAAAADLVGDRPDFTESALAVAPGSLQLEAGGTLTTSDAVDAREVGEVLLRYGLRDGTELRVVLPSFVDLDAPDAPDRSGATNGALGLKHEVQQGDGARPQVAVVGHVALPVGAEDVGAGDTAVDLVLAAEWALHPRVGFGLNVGGEVVFAADTESRQWFSGAFGIGVTDRLGLFVEGFSFTDELEAFTSYLDTGLTYLLHDDLQIDVRVGQGLDDVDDETFYGAGLVARF